MIDKGYLGKQIADAMNRSKSGINKEIKRGVINEVYDPKKAHHKAYVRRKYARYQSMKIVENKELRAFVEKALLDDQSPENTAGRVTHHEGHLPRISKDIVYKFINSPYGRKIEHARKKQRQRNKRRQIQKEKLRDRTFIDKRPKYIDERERIGDSEADFIISGKGGRGILLSVIDRKARKPYIERILPVSIPNTHRAFQRIKSRFPEMKTITTDNDILFQHHKELEKLLNIKMYFCHQYHSWEKGSIENLNKLIRRDIPKGSDISKWSRYRILKIEEKLSRHYYKCLKFKTPNEVLSEYRKKKKRSTKARKKKI